MKKHYSAALTAFLFGVAVVVVAASGTVTSRPVDQTPTLLERLMEEHDCWTGGEPAPVEYPLGVVYSKDGKPPRYSSKPARVSQALDHEFGVSPIEGLIVYGFCL